MGVTWLTAFLDTPAPVAEQSASFWSAVTGWPVAKRRGREGELATLLPPDGAAFVKVQVVGEPPPGMVHLDVHTDDVPALAAEVTRLGGEVVTHTGGYAVCRSPGGLTFCVVGHEVSGRPGAATWPGGRSLVDQVCLDIPERVFEREAGFWAALLGWPRSRGRRPELDSLLRPPGIPLRILLQRLGDGEEGPVRAHLDLASDDVGAEVVRHVGLGATVARVEEHWTTLTDPAGRTYCVTRRRPDTGTLP